MLEGINWFDAVVIALIVLFGLRGLANGIIKEIFGILGLIGGLILAVRYNVADFGLIYAGAQKNIGPAGVTIVIVREDLLNDEPVLSSMLDYRIQSDNDSLYNTPPTYGIYMARLVFDYVASLGGVDAMQAKNIEKANLLYDFIDQSEFYSNPVATKADRSICNIPFVTPTDDLDKLFNKEALEHDFKNIKNKYGQL